MIVFNKYWKTYQYFLYIVKFYCFLELFYHQNFDLFAFYFTLSTPELSKNVYYFLSKLTIIFFSNKAFKKFNIELHTPKPPT